MGAKLLGAHMPASKGLGQAVRNGKEIGCAAVQVFTSSPRQWKGKVITKEMIDDLDKARKETGITEIVSHDTYLINLSAEDPENRAKSIKALTDEIQRCAQLGIGYVVSHMGGYKNRTPEECMQIVAEATTDILEQTDDSVTLCMETTAGQGSSLNSKFEELARILELCHGHKRLAVCLDTCHIFAAGYDIRTEEKYTTTWETFDSIVGLDRLKVIHCNDSKMPFASRKDRHADIGKGEIGPTAFSLLVNDKRLENIPILLETPNAEEHHKMNLDTLKSYIK